MNFSASEIEELVREVLRRLNPTEQTINPNKKTPTINRVEIGERVVATEQIAMVPEEATARIQETAVVTPAARELAAERKIVLERGAASGSIQEMLSLYAVSPQVGQLAESLGREFTLDAMEKHDRTVDAVRAASNLLKKKEAGSDTPLVRCLLLSGEVETAVLLANRSPHVRAVVYQNLGQLRRAMGTVEVNMLILDPLGRSRCEVVEAGQILLHGPSHPHNESLHTVRHAIGN